MPDTTPPFTGHSFVTPAWLDIERYRPESPGELQRLAWIYPLPDSWRPPLFEVELSVLISLYRNGLHVEYARNSVERCGLGGLLRAVDQEAPVPQGYVFVHTACALLTSPHSLLLREYYPEARYGVHVVSYARRTPIQ